MPEYFVAADLVALPYEHIYDSGVLRIAFAFSKPVMATRVGIFRDLLENDKNAILVDNGLAALKEGLRKFLNLSIDDLETMGRLSRKMYAEYLDWDTVATRTVALYNKLLR